MNTVLLPKQPPVTPYRIGDLFRTADNDVYLLIRPEERPSFVAVNLATGNRWHNSPESSAEEAIQGLTFLGRDATFEISFSK